MRRLLVAVGAAAALGALAFVFLLRGSASNGAAAGAFADQPPPADTQISVVQMQKNAGEPASRFTRVTADTKLNPGDVVELEVPGGFSTAIVANASDGGTEWVDVMMRANNRRYTVSRQVLTLIR